jgi:type IV secretion system protein VirB3
MDYVNRVTVVRKSLLETKTFFGVESRMAILNWTITLALGMGLESVYILAVGMFTHTILRWLTKKDIHLMAIYQRFNLLGHVYDPWPHARNKMNSRPKGFGRGMLC